MKLAKKDSKNKLSDQITPSNICCLCMPKNFGNIFSGKTKAFCRKPIELMKLAKKTVKTNSRIK